MNRLIVLILVTLFSFGFSVTSMAQEVPIMVKGLVWDSDSWGFAFYQNLSNQQALQKAARRGARVSVDGHPDVFAITGEGGKFEFTLTTSQPTFRLIVEGDRFPRTITQPFTVPEGGGEQHAEGRKRLPASAPCHRFYAGLGTSNTLSNGSTGGNTAVFMCPAWIGSRLDLQTPPPPPSASPRVRPRHQPRDRGADPRTGFRR